MTEFRHERRTAAAAAAARSPGPLLTPGPTGAANSVFGSTPTAATSPGVRAGHIRAALALTAWAQDTAATTSMSPRTR